MCSLKGTERYIAFLRGINVGGHHKVPMAELRKEFEKLGYKDIVTLLNSGNVLFDAIPDSIEQLEELISADLTKSFGFSIPAIIRTSEMINGLLNSEPFKDVEHTKDIRLYVSLLRQNSAVDLKLPWTSQDKSYEIMAKMDNTILSVLDLSISNTPKAMGAMERFFGSDITTRNWKTIERIGGKLNTGG